MQKGGDQMIISNSVFKVYVHTNKINNKIYVGITKRSTNERWRNGEGYKECPYFYNAIQKYGWSNFCHDIYADNLTESEAKNMENLLITKFNLTNDNYGYNIKNGGTDCSLAEETKIKIGNALRGRTYSEEKRKRYSNAHKGKKLSSEHAAAISKANKGRPRTEKELTAAKINGNKMSGDNHWTRRLGITDETKSKISKSLKQYYQINKTHESVNKKRVLQVETGVIYDSIESAAKTLSVCRSQISEAADGKKRKTAGGFHWKFV